MATITTQTAPGGTAALPAPRGRAGFAGAVRSEFTKIRSTRSTYWTLLALIVVTVGLGALVSFGAAQHPGETGPGFDATQRSLGGLYVSQLVIVVLGALTITSEYSTGMIRTSLTAQPRRSVVFAAKAAVFAAMSLATGLVVSFLSFFVGQAILSGHHSFDGTALSVSLGDPNVLRAVIGGGLFLAACGMLAFGLGMLLRHTAGAITASIGLLFVLSILVNFLPQSWQDHVDKWMPAIAGTQIWATKPDPAFLAPWTGFAVLCGYAAAAIIGGLIVFRGRDA
jgi:ABC-type transport system involved in multi-copper enzyme maturation permease subunit